MNEEEFITKFYSCDNEEQFLKDICHNLNCLQKIQNNWNELKKYVQEELKEAEDDFAQEDFIKVLDRMQELEQGKDE